MKSVVVLASGTGTNAEAIVKRFAGHESIKVTALFSNRAEAPVIGKMRAHGIPTEVYDKEAWREGEEIVRAMEHYRPDLIVLAGFLAIISEPILTAYKGKIINLHPSLLPKYGGKGMYGNRVHEAVKASGDAETGITIHYVSKEIDGGGIIAQYRIGIEKGMSVEEIAEKVHEAEHAYLPKVIEEMVLHPKRH